MSSNELVSTMFSNSLTREISNGIVNANGRKYASPNADDTLINIQNSYKELLGKMGEVVLAMKYNNYSNMIAEATHYKIGLELLFRKITKKMKLVTSSSNVNFSELNELKIMQLNLCVLWNHIDGLTYNRKGGSINKSKKSRRHSKNKKSRRH